MPKIDFAQDFGSSGIIEFETVQVLSSVHYLVKILKIRNLSEEIIFDANKIKLKLLKLTNLKGLKSIQNPEIGKMVAIQHENIWKRGIFSGENQIFLVDEGKIVNSKEFFAIPEEFEKIPRLVTEIVLLNVKPKDEYLTFPKEADDKIGTLGTDQGEWNVFYLFLHDIAFEDNCKKMP